jgi:hypothetical protein
LTEHTPKALYKYRDFSVNTLQLLTYEQVYYASPAKFNDPLDCDPTLQIDIELKSLERLCYKMLEGRVGDENARKKIGHHRYMSTEHGDYRTNAAAEECYRQDLLAEIRDLLFGEFEAVGVLSMARRWNCPLMWSHYADQHRGLCIGYDLRENACPNIRPINYGGSRSIKLSDLVAWKIDGSESSAKRVRDIFFFSKAANWRYEREWRDLADEAGSSPAPFRIREIYFGWRCSHIVVVNVVKLLMDSARAIKFYHVHPHEDSFRLKRSDVDTSEILAVGVSTSVLLDFKPTFDTNAESTS